jgi:hypothetical protein
MGLALSILYFVTYYLTPPTVFGPLALYRVELILAALVFFASLPAIPKTSILKTPQSLALIGLAVATSLSVLIATHWLGGTLNAFLLFLPNAFAYLLVCLHCNSKKKLQVVVAMLLFVCLFVIARGGIDLLHGVPQGGPQRSEDESSDDEALWNAEHPYLLAMKNDSGELIYRVRGQGLINDPNDFGQIVVCVVPLMFIFWRAKKKLQNAAFVLLPVSVLLFGVFLTHSRGALLALMAMAAIAVRRRIGTIPALLVAGGLFVAAMALHFTGGREISASSGSDRTVLWGEGLQMLKSHPLFGVGAGGFADNCDDCGHTAHNSIVVCAAELGLFGLYFWSLFLLPSVKDALTVASPAKVSEGEPIVVEEGLYPMAPRSIQALDKAEINHLGRLVLLSLTGFLVAGMFLSRAFVLTLFLLGGLAEVVYEMALRRGMVAPRMRLAPVMAYTAGLTVALVPAMYIMILILNRMQ